MADTQEFEQFALPLSRISPALLAELHACVAEKLHIEGDRLIIRHLWLERRMQPLNLSWPRRMPQSDVTRLKSMAMPSDSWRRPISFPETRRLKTSASRAMAG